MPKSCEQEDVTLDEGALRRAEALDVLDTIFPFDRRDQLAVLLTDDDVDVARQLVADGVRQNTIRALVSDLAYLQAWSRAVTGSPLPFPAPESLLHTFVSHHLWDEQRRAIDPSHGMPTDVQQSLTRQKLLKSLGPHAPTTVRRRIASWATMTRQRGLEGAFNDASFRLAVRLTAVSNEQPQRPMSAIAVTEDVLAQLLSTCSNGDLVDLRDRAILLLASATGGMRRAEITDVRLDDLMTARGKPIEMTARRKSHVKIKMGLPGSSEQVDLIGAAAEALMRWIKAAGISNGPVFRKVDQWGNVSRRTLTPQSVNLIVKARAAKAGLDPKLLSARGLRVGATLSGGNGEAATRQR
jgi:integrase